MAYNINDRLTRLTKRRDPEDLILNSSRRVEDFQKRSSNKATQYTLGAMQAVDDRYTEISMEEAAKVEQHLVAGLAEYSETASYRLQGSVPLDVHIKGKSDVDLLVIHGLYLRRAECANSRKSYFSYTGAGSIELDVASLRAKCEEKLERRFHGATVDKSAAKSIKLTGGAFRRDVDVVPSAWFDTAEYQTQLNEKYRGVEILNKEKFDLVRNYPFLYNAKVEERDYFTLGGAKRAIRLLKNIKSDSEANIELSSYDIGSLIYHCPQNYITAQMGNELLILAGVDLWLTELCENWDTTLALKTPDETRAIIDSVEKKHGLVALASEVGNLTREVEFEWVGRNALDRPDRSIILKNLRGAYIPLAA